jgi:two-component system NtrC family response regulator
MKPKLLVVDDDEEICTQMKWALAQDFEVFAAADRQSALAVFSKERPAVVTLDLGLPPCSHSVEEGLQTLRVILHLDRGAKVIIITGHEAREHAREAIGSGAYDVFCKPIQIEALKVLLCRALHVYQLEQELHAQQQALPQASFANMLGISPQMQAAFATIRQVAATDVPVLIRGESGTGKELVARAIHQHSTRCHGPFVAINCGAIPDTLLESELFGHEKGAFTGAHMQRKGRIELAQGGTLFLDEICELSPPLQVKLLRFLQEYQLERIGGRQTLRIDARVLAATNSDLERAIVDSRFREDLYYRLGVVRITLPTLRERGADVVMLAQALLQQYVAETRKAIKNFDPQALIALQRHEWPGNVRELENRIKRAVILAKGPLLTPADLELTALDTPSDSRTLKEARGAFEREFILQALARNQGHLTRTAAELGVSRPTLHDMMAKYAIERQPAPAKLTLEPRDQP